MENSIEIMLGVLDYVQGEMFNDAKVVDIGNYSSGAYADLECINKDKIKIQIKYEPHVEEQGDEQE